MLKIRHYIKDCLLFFTVFFGYLPTLFHGSKARVHWFLLVNHSRRIDFYFLYLGNAVSFLIFISLLLFPKGISKNMKVYIFIVCVLDLLHFLLLSKLYFSFIKLIIAWLIYRLLKNLGFV
jgi:hypothetical protein